jgi:UDP-N-acetylmuramoyl-tripeptide--D-alanyl-D-alanine ligase
MILMFKSIIRKRLEKYVTKYLQRHPEVRLIIVVGSVGKTSTKMAIGTVLSQRYRVRLHEGNHNAELSAPLALLGVEYPDNVKSVGEWLRVFKAAKQRIKDPTDVDVIVQEVGTDGIGQVPHFGTYARPYLAVVTAISDEHMEFFKTLDAVAAEELSAANYSQTALINRDDIEGKYAQLITNPNFTTYGTSTSAEYSITQTDFNLENGIDGRMNTPTFKEADVRLHVVGEHSIRAAAAAVAVGEMFGLTIEQLQQGLDAIRPVAGRMNMLRGMNDTIIIDDTYNSSPLAAMSAIRTLYQFPAPQRIAVLGSMNELGDVSASGHAAVGSLCDPIELAYVVTVGEEANKYLAPAAIQKGCRVIQCRNAIEAGAEVHKLLEKGAMLLFKGSQGGVYLEEAVKMVLHATEEDHQLVRQSPKWMATKQRFFESFQ